MLLISHALASLLLGPETDSAQHSNIRSDSSCGWGSPGRYVLRRVCARYVPKPWLIPQTPAFEPEAPRGSEAQNPARP